MKTKIDGVTLFWVKVLRPSVDSCWPWVGALDGNGYGTFNRKGKKEKAHRQAWRLTQGEIPKHIEVCHKCFQKTCCNPAHLFLGTHKDNMDSAVQKLEMRQGEQHACAKLTVEKVKEMRRLYATGTLSYEKIAKIFGVTMMPAWAAITRKTWKSVP